ncbi:hypothetical protein EGM_17748 [Macaca fascicularis]|uniref:Uncharacterized protein n=1 Tax=Macaca fascicularis TaxID=9541 RepID=G7PE32_MACFA|nr:hypothetical protein EGM_17748 [Macaca fascicularis]
MNTLISTPPPSNTPLTSPLPHRSLQKGAQMRRNHSKEKARWLLPIPVRSTYKGKDRSPIQTRRRILRKPTSRLGTALLDPNQSPTHIGKTAGKEKSVPRTAAKTEQGTVQKRSAA